MDLQQSSSPINNNTYTQSLYNQMYSPVQNELAHMSLIQREHTATTPTTTATTTSINTNTSPTQLNNWPSQIEPEMTTSPSMLLSHDNIFNMNQQQVNSSGMNTEDHKPSMRSQEQHSTLDQPIVPSQRTLEQQQTSFQQRKIEEEQERVAAAAQQVMAQQMAQQYAMLQQQQQQQQQATPVVHSVSMMVSSSQVSQQESTPHVVLSQIASMPTTTTTTTSTTTTTPVLHQVKSDNISLHNAIVQQQHHQQQQQRMALLNEKPPGLSINTKRLGEIQENPGFLRKKSRRHTFSNSGPPQLNIDTKNLMSNAPQSAMVRSNGFFNFNLEEQKQTFSPVLTMPMPANQVAPTTNRPTTAEDYENMSREQLIARLVVLENERRNQGNEEKDVDMEVEQKQLSIDTNVTCHNKSDDDEDISPSTPAESESRTSLNEEEIEEEEEELELKEQLECKWKDCDKKFTKLQALISHINDDHVGSGKPTYCCEWKDCPRNQKPFTKRHKMYNHLRTHTGERPFVCTKPGCGKRFSRPDSLTTHIKTHSNVRPFLCQIKGCGKAYYHSRSLKKHEKTHEVTLPYPISSQYHYPPPLPQQQQMDYMPMNSQSLPNSPHPTTTLPSQTSFAIPGYTPQQQPPFPLPSSTSSGIIEQQQPIVYDSVNQNNFKYAQ